MKKEEKIRPRSNKTKKVNLKEKIFKCYYKEMEEKTKEYNNSHNTNVNFYLAQELNKKDFINNVIELSYFYDKNFTGNKDFMHIPSMKQVANNIIHFPIMLATQKLSDGIDDVLGATTIKIEKHKSMKENPLFPTRGETVLSITGVLTKFNNIYNEENRVRGIGKELYKSAIRGAININKKQKIRLICEIDCRNDKSLSAVTKAVKDLQLEGYDICSYITGYYEIYKKKELLEAPTFIIEIDLNSNKYTEEKVEFSYIHCKSQKLYKDLVKELKKNTTEQKKYSNVVGNKSVYYHSIKPINTENVELEIGTTADGNNRKPSINPVIEYVVSKKTINTTTSTDNILAVE